MKKWIEKYCFYLYVALLFSICIGVPFIGIYFSNIEQEKRDVARQHVIAKLEIDGFKITKIEVNSPTIYVTFDIIQEFVDEANNREITEIYNSGQSLYFFNDELTIGYKCTLYNLEKLEDFLIS